MLIEYPGYEIENFESEGGSCSVDAEHRTGEYTMSNKSRQPVTQKAGSGVRKNILPQSEWDMESD